MSPALAGVAPMGPDDVEKAVIVLKVLHESSAKQCRGDGREELAVVHDSALTLLDYTLELHRENVAAPAGEGDEDKNRHGLLPCPFCGSAGAYPYTRSGTDTDIAIRCNGCGATTADFKSDPRTFSGEPDAIAAWNRRLASAGSVPVPSAVRDWKAVAAHVASALEVEGWIKPNVYKPPEAYREDVETAVRNGLKAAAPTPEPPVGEQ